MLATSHPVIDLLVVVFVAVYLLPTFVAIARKHHWILRIATVNVVLGWTVVGWVVALHMSSTSRTRLDAYWHPDPSHPQPPAGGFVPAHFEEQGASERSALLQEEE